MRTILLATALGLVACAGPQKPNEPSGPNEPGDRKICTQEATTGSNINHTVCRSAQQKEDERKAGQEFFTPLARPKRAE